VGKSNNEEQALLVMVPHITSRLNCQACNAINTAEIKQYEMRKLRPLIWFSGVFSAQAITLRITCTRFKSVGLGFFYYM
jgi:hypothetical protein